MSTNVINLGGCDFNDLVSAVSRRIGKTRKECCPSTSGSSGNFLTENTTTVTLLGNGSAANKLRAIVNVSADDNNLIEVRSDGLYVNATSGISSVFTDDTNTVNLLGLGTDVDPIVANVNISAQLGNAITALSDGLYSPVFIQNGLLWGGIVTWTGTNYIHDVSPASYVIAGQPGFSLSTQVNLSDADATYDRIDLIVADLNGDVVVIEGVPAENPVEPSYDPQTQIPLRFIVVTANTTEPVVPQQWIYRENVEWTTFVSTARIKANSIVTPDVGILCIEATNAVVNDFIRLTAPVAPTMSLYNVLTFKMKSKAAWLNSSSGIKIQFYNGGTPQGTAVNISNFSFGFESSNIADYQVVSIPLSFFGSPTSVTNVVVTINGLSSAFPIGFFIDEMQLTFTDLTFSDDLFFKQYGNGFGTTAVLGTKDNHDLAIITNNIEKARFTKAGLFQISGNQYLYGTNPAISFFTGTLAGSDYYIQRNGTSLIMNAAGQNVFQVSQKTGYNINANTARGHEWYDMKSPTSSVIAQLLPSGQFSLKTYVGTTWDASPTKAIGVDAVGNFVTFDPGGGGGGTVTSFSAGNLSPLFTTNVATASTTPALSFSLYTQTANTVFAGPVSGGAAAPTFRALVAADIAGLYTVANGLTPITTTTFELGGTLNKSTTINSATFPLIITGSVNGNSVTIVNNNTGVVYGLNVAASDASATGITSSGGNIGIQGSSPTGIGGVFSSGGLYGLQASSTGGAAADFQTSRPSAGTVVPIITYERYVTGGFGANNDGGSLDLNVETTDGTAQLSNQIITKWTNATTISRVSEFSITGVNNAVTATLLVLSGNGAFKLNNYGDNLFTGTETRLLGVDIDGNVIEINPASYGGGGGATGTVETVSIATANGFAGTSDADPADPVLTITTTVTGILIGNGTSISAAVSGTDYLPAIGGTSITTVGTLTLGTWSANTIAVNRGGTGNTSYTNGQILIGGNTGNTLTKATLTQGTGMVITNGDGSITIASAFNHAIKTSSSSSFTWDVNEGENAIWTITGTTNAITLSNIVAGRFYNLQIVQADGADTVSSWPAGILWFGGIAPTLSDGAGESDFVVMYYNGINLIAQFNPLAGSIIPLVGGGTGASLADPNADRIMFWDDSAGAVTWLEVGSGLSITGTVLSASGGGGTSPFLPVTGTGTATGAIIGALDGNTLVISQAGNEFLHLDPTAGAEHSHLRAFNTTDDGNYVTFVANTTNTTSIFDVIASFNGETVGAIITGTAQSGSSSIEYSADTHTFTGPLVLNGSTSGTVTINSDALSNALNGTTLSGTGVVWSTLGAYVDSDYTLSDVGTAQNVFPSGYDTWTLQASTTYRFKGKYFISTGTVTVAMSFALAGGASVTSIRYGVISGVMNDGSTTSAQLMGRHNSVSSWIVTGSSATPGRYIDFEGTIRMNAGGTITPQITFSAAPGGTNLLNANSFIEFTPIGTDTVTSIGPVS